jgi:tetratricopeptide (TPR) repeat protein
VFTLLLGGGCSKQYLATRHLARADRFFSSLEYDTAEIEYLKVLQAMPRHPVALRQLGTIYQGEGNWPRAYAFLQKAIELDPENVQAHLQLGLTYAALQDRNLATKEANWVLKKQPGQEDALAILVDTCSPGKPAEQMAAQIRALRQTDTDRSGYHAALATLYLKQQDLTNAEVEIRHALELDPRSAPATMALGNAYLLRHDFTNAEIAFKTAADLSPIRSARRLTYIEFKLRTGGADVARTMLKDVNQKAPDYLPAWNRLAQLALEQKDFAECDTCLQHVLARSRSNYDALLLTGLLKLAKGEPSQAATEFERMAAMFERSPQVQFELGRAYLIAGETAKASTALNRAVAYNPNFADPILLLANINLRKGETIAAIAALTDLLKKQPDLPQGYLLLASAYLIQKDPDQAVEVCRRMEARFPKSPEVPMVLGSVLVAQKRPDEARKAFNRALELAPNSLPVIEQLIDLDLSGKRYAEALDRADKQVESHPDSAEARLLVAKVHLAKAEASAKGPGGTVSTVGSTEAGLEFNQAESALLKSIELNPALKTPYLLLASLYVSSNRQQQALDRLNSFLAKTNDVAARMQVGIIEERLHNYSAARDAYERVLSSSPNFSLALNNLAYLYSEHFTDLEKAYRLAERARRLLPNDPAVADTLGWILFKRGEYSRALGIIDDSASKRPTDPEIQYHLGMVHYMLLEEGPARLALERAVQSTADFPGKEDARRRLGLLAMDVATADDRGKAELDAFVHDHPTDPLALCRQASLQERKGDISGAQRALQEALKASPDNPQILTRLAQVYASDRSHDAKTALEFAKRAHAVAPDDARVSAILGRLAFSTGDFNWAVSLLETSDRRLPNDTSVAYDLAWAYYSLGRESDAEGAMRRALGTAGGEHLDTAKRFLSFVSGARDPVGAQKLKADAEKCLDPDLLSVPARWLLARVYEQDGNYSQAAESYEEILKRFPLFAPATRNLAVIYTSKLPNDSRGYKLALQAREIFPQDAELGEALGILEYRNGNYARAAQLLRESAQARPGDPELFYYLGLTQYRLKATKESKAALQKALALNIQPKLADDAKRILLELR